MNYEDLVAAKVRLIEVGNTTALWVAAGIVVVGLIMLSVALARRNKWDVSPLWVLGGVAFFIAAVVAASSAYRLATADIQARADLANYGVIEVKK